MNLFAKLAGQGMVEGTLKLAFQVFDRVSGTETTRLSEHDFTIEATPKNFLSEAMRDVPDGQGGVTQEKYIHNGLTQEWVDAQVRVRLAEIAARLAPEAEPAPDLSQLDLATGKTAREITQD